jgi:hypothetical protein
MEDKQGIAYEDELFEIVDTTDLCRSARVRRRLIACANPESIHDAEWPPAASFVRC